MITPSNLEFLKPYKNRTDCIILVYINEKNEVTPNKLRLVYSKSTYDDVVEFLGIYKEFRILRIFGGSLVDF